MKQGNIWTVADGPDCADKPRPITSRLMADKINTAHKPKLGANIGRLSDKDILRLNQAMLVFLGLAVAPGSVRRG